MRSSRFQSLSPPLRTSGLRRLKTAFSPSSSTSSNRSYGMSAGSSVGPNSYPSSSSSTSTTSPLSMSMESQILEAHSPTGSSSSACYSNSTTKSQPFTICSIGPAALDQDHFAPQEELPGHFAPLSARSRLLRFWLVRRQPRASVWEKRVEEEQRSFGAGMRLFEPRPKGQIVMGGIFEVLEGRI